jgi:hypothetical protein
MARSQCASCSEVFFSISGFNMHRAGGYGDAVYDGKKVIGHTKPDRRCLSIVEMQSLGMVKTDKDIWTTGEFDGSVFEKRGTHGEI